jgi:hypothetical protein
MNSYQDMQAALDGGVAIRRAGWPPGEFMARLPAVEHGPDMINERTRRYIDAGVSLKCQMYHVRGNRHSGVWNMEWCPSVADMAARDWTEVCDHADQS